MYFSTPVYTRTVQRLSIWSRYSRDNHRRIVIANTPNQCRWKGWGEVCPRVIINDKLSAIVHNKILNFHYVIWYFMSHILYIKSIIYAVFQILFTYTNSSKIKKYIVPVLKRFSKTRTVVATKRLLPELQNHRKRNFEEISK